MRQSKKYKSLAQVNLVVFRAMQDMIVNDLEPYLKKRLQDKIEEIVYESYTPVVYRRREEAGGLKDIRLMESVTLHSAPISGILQRLITQKTQLAKLTTGSTILAPRIQEEAGFAGDPAIGMPPRPYLEYLEKEIETNPSGVNNIIRKGFAKHGIRVRIRS